MYILFLRWLIPALIKWLGIFWWIHHSGNCSSCCCEFHWLISILLTRALVWWLPYEILELCLVRVLILQKLMFVVNVASDGFCTAIFWISMYEAFLTDLHVLLLQRGLLLPTKSCVVLLTELKFDAVFLQRELVNLVIIIWLRRWSDLLWVVSIVFYLNLRNCLDWLLLTFCENRSRWMYSWITALNLLCVLFEFNDANRLFGVMISYILLVAILTWLSTGHEGRYVR